VLRFLLAAREEFGQTMAMVTHDDLQLPGLTCAVRSPVGQCSGRMGS
jgi:hypothetical protein